MRLLVTRPRRKAEALGEHLREMGHKIVIEPMLDIHLLPLPPLAAEQFIALILTSANAVEAMQAGGAIIDFAQTPVFCVGGATARAARAAGFNDVTSADGDGAALSQLISNSLKPGQILHICGRHGRAEPAASLTRAGFKLVAVTGYEARPRAALSPATAAALHAGALDAVLLYSPRSAEILCRLVEKSGHDASFSVAFCLSAAIARAAAPLAAQTQYPATPDTNSLLELIAAWGRG